MDLAVPMRRDAHRACSEVLFRTSCKRGDRTVEEAETRMVGVTSIGSLRQRRRCAQVARIQRPQLHRTALRRSVPSGLQRTRTGLQSVPRDTAVDCRTHPRLAPADAKTSIQPNREREQGAGRGRVQARAAFRCSGQRASSSRDRRHANPSCGRSSVATRSHRSCALRAGLPVITRRSPTCKLMPVTPCCISCAAPRHSIL